MWTARVKLTAANPTGEFRVPLSDAALAVLDQMPRIGRYVFPGQSDGKPISDSAIRTFVLRDMGYGASDCTIHGFRSSFRDWAAECTSFPNHVVRDGAGAFNPERSRSRLSPWRSFPETAQADGGVGCLLWTAAGQGAADEAEDDIMNPRG